MVQNEEDYGWADTHATAIIRNISFNLLVMNGFKSIFAGISNREDNILAFSETKLILIQKVSYTVVLINCY